MTVKRILMGEWAPDLPSSTGTENNNLADAKIVFPNNVGYSPFPSTVVVSPEADQDLTSVYAGKDGDLVQIFAGSESKLYNVYSSGSPVGRRALSFDGPVVIESVGREDPVYAPSDEAWSFEQFGKKVLACKNNNVIQQWLLGKSIKFEDLTLKDEEGNIISTAPTAKCMTIVRDQVVAGNIGAGDDPNLVMWSDLNIEGNWKPGPASQADSQYIADGGAILNMTGGEIGMIFLENAVYRMSYSGSPLFFSFEKISTIGCFEGRSVIEDNGTSYYLAKDGFYMTNGNAVTPIGAEKIDEWFFANAKVSDLITMSATVNPIQKLIIWNFEDNFGNRQNLIYHTESNRWSRAETDATSVGALATLGTSLEKLSVLYPDLDTDVPAPLDDRVFVGGRYIFAGTTGKKLISFTAPCINPRLETLDIEDGYQSVVTMARPIIDNGSADVSVASRQALDDTIEFGAVAEPYENRNNLRSGGRYHRIRVEPVGNWTTAVATDITITPSGQR